MATKNRLSDRIQCVAIDTNEIGIRDRYGRDGKYVERWDPRGEVTLRAGRDSYCMGPLYLQCGR